MTCFLSIFIFPELFVIPFFLFSLFDMKCGGQIWNDCQGMTDSDVSCVQDRTYGALEKQLAEGNFIVEGKLIEQNLSKIGRASCRERVSSPV